MVFLLEGARRRIKAKRLSLSEMCSPRRTVMWHQCLIKLPGTEESLSSSEKTTPSATEW